jgi:hypothetical protein
MGKSFTAIFADQLGERCDADEPELAAVLAHNIWFQRNSVVHGGS